METPNLKSIAQKHGIIDGFTLHSNPAIISREFEEYTKEVWNAAIEKAAEEAEAWCNEGENPEYGVDKQSILLLKI